jgi:hypothetical protein
MVTQRRTLFICLASIMALVAACDKVPLLAPTGSVINLIVSTTSASLNSEVTIVATVIENGQAVGGSGGTTVGARPGAGTPVQNGTLITFTTTIGVIEPSEARTHNGQVTVKLLTGTTSGTASITAYSGGASTSFNTLKIGTAAAKTVAVTTNPQSLGSTGGTVQVIAAVTDEGGSGVGGVPVTFSTDRGSISPSTVTTDSSGTATAALTTNQAGITKVTANVGTLTGSANVTVSARSLTSFIAGTSATTTGVPITFTVTPTSGANISNVHVDFGDGRTFDMGPISGGTGVPHAYTASGVYTATASANGEPPLSATVSIGQLPITLGASPSPGNVNAPVTFTVSNLPANAQVDHYEWAFDDGVTSPPTSGPQTTVIFRTPGIKTARADAFAVGGGKIGSATISIRIQ